MVNWQQTPDLSRQRLSALMDGELVGSEQDAAWQQACESFGAEPGVREDWHVYHLIGDALRSEDLVRDEDDAGAFLAAFRGRLQQEPVVLAPSPRTSPAALEVGDGAAAGASLAVSPRRRSAWYVAPAAVAAGFAVVAGSLVLLRGEGVQGTGPAAQLMSLLGGGQATSVAVQSTPASLDMLRDARLEGYLAAHRRVANGVAVSVPGDVARSVQAVSLEAR